MKSINYILFAILLLGANYTSAQTTTHCVKILDINTGAIKWQECPTITSISISTPNKTSVTVYQWVNTDWTSTIKNDINNYYRGYYNNRITFEAEATVKYNCHSWAWAGSTTCWMPSSQEQKYFSSTDQSYILTTNAALATKVWYGGISLGGII